ncbi:MAG: hypothetical protein H0T56_16560 [Pseudaminobacter sp.]|nr:hypothetical protein [Pseudaminobacter sp.]
MRTLLSGAVVLAVFSAPAAAGPRYDIKLEKAVMAIVAKRIGDIRGGFSLDRKPEFVQPAPDAAEVATDPVETGSVDIPRTHSDRLVVAKDDHAAMSERKVSRIIAF